MAMSDLPSDLEEEILCRVPATSLKRLRTTCKRWNSLYKNERFVRNHCEKAPKQFLSLMLTKEYIFAPMSINLPSVEVKGELCLVDPNNSAYRFGIYRVTHCDGLLLCVPDDKSRICVWNPLTNQTRWIQAGDQAKKSCQFYLGYKNSSSGKSYKVLFFHGFNESRGLEIYDFHSDSWRILDDDITPRWSQRYNHHSVSLHGNMYCFAIDTTKPHLGVVLLKFDFSTERYTTLPLPYQCPSYETACMSLVREEKLSVMLLKEDHSSKTEIWLTNKIDVDGTQAVSWTKVLSLDLSPALQIREIEASFLLDEEKKVLVCCDRFIVDDNGYLTKDMIYIVGEDNKVTQIDFGVDETDGCWPAILNYVPSLVQLEHARGKRKRVH